MPGVTTLFDQISNAVTTHHVQDGTSAALPSALLSARAGATVCMAPSRNAGMGDFLLVSGATTEFFNFRTLDSEAGPAMNASRALHAYTTLNDGRVMFIGGLDATAAVTTSCEIYDPVADTFTTVAPLPGPRAGHAAATMPDGRVLVTWNYIADDKANDGYYERALLYTISRDSGVSWSEQKLIGPLADSKHLGAVRHNVLPWSKDRWLLPLRVGPPRIYDPRTGATYIYKIAAQRSAPQRSTAQHSHPIRPYWRKN